ncbi:RHS repeat domain-containing protein [Chitinimonas koreensis]|uniref:RHS repeat domain-containing protein n=1 Tax=Chitinimonas koreensis TaxID=356302 RepID=UPI000416676C|nr:DUF6531 domain-containing protein [Chitinimonas koreensis]QNM97782.1 hypothetical protein H9L41_05785 [Chitinimonas koreensis]
MMPITLRSSFGSSALALLGGLLLWSAPAPAQAAACDPTKQCCGGGTPGGSTCGGGGAASLGNGSGTNQGAGNPINVITGNKFQQETDLPALPGVLGLEIVRYYNSQYALAEGSRGIVGRGWKLSYETVLQDLGDSIRIVQADGTPAVFRRGLLQPGRYLAADPQQGQLVVSQAGLRRSYVWTWPNGRTLGFDAGGRLLRISAPTGETVNLAYDPHGWLLRVTDPQGRSLVFNYPGRADAAGRYAGVQRIDSPAGRFEYGYGSEGGKPAAAAAVANLARVTLPDDSAGQAAVRRYHYEDPRFPSLLTGISVEQPDGRGQRSARRIGSYGYDAQGRANLTVKGEPARFAAGRLVDGTGIEQLNLSWPKPGEVVLSTPQGGQTRYRTAEIAGQPRLTEVAGDDCAHCAPANTRYGYDRAGRLAEQTTLDANGRPIHAERTERDPYGRPLRVSRIDYQDGKPQPPRLLVRYEYPAADGGSPSAARPSLIARPSVVAGQEHQVRVRYDRLGQPLEVTESGYRPVADDADEPAAAGAISRTTRFRYKQVDGRSVLAEVDGPLPNGPLGSPQDSDVTRYEWNARATAVVSVLRPGGRRIRIAATDAAGRPQAVEWQWDGLRHALRYRYGHDGRLRSVEETAYTADGERSRTTRFAAAEDETAGPSAETGPAAPGASALADAGAVLAAAEPPAGLLPELEARYGREGTAAADEVLQFRAGDRSARRLLDDFGRVVAIRNPGQGWQTASYDEADRLTGTVDPRGATATARYDAAGRLLEVVRAWQGRAETSRFKWQAMARIKAAVLVDGQVRNVVRSDYSPWGQPIRQTVEIAGAAPVSLGQQFNYDDEGRLLSTTLPSGVRLAYRYFAEGEARGQLAAIEQVRWPRLLDPLMLRLPEWLQYKTALSTFKPQAAQAVTAADDEPWSPVAADGLAETAPGSDFDPAGLPHRLATARGRFVLEWDAAGRLAQVSDEAGTVVARYGYDADGRRVSKTTAAGTEYYLYRGSQLQAVADAGGKVRSEYVYRGYRPVLWRHDGEAYALHTDARGAVLAASDAGTAAVRWRSGIDAWGALRGQGQAGFDPKLRLVNQYADEETGLSYHVARYYDPAAGRFISPDPAGVADSLDGDTPAALRLDLTAYAGGQPEAFFDPDGAAKIRYYAIDDGARRDANLMPRKAHWAFVISDIAGMPNRTLIYDKSGSYIQGGKAYAYHDDAGAAQAVKGFTDFYQGRSGYYSPSAFEVQLDDEAAKTIIQKLTGIDQGIAQCPAKIDALMPKIDMGVQGTLDPMVAKGEPNRFIPCQANATAEDVRFARIKKAIEVHESGDKDCATATHSTCPAGTWNPALVPETTKRPAASYGWVQFIFATFMGEIRVNFANYKTALESLGITQAKLDTAATLAAKTGQWFDKITETSSWATDGATFADETKLTKRDYDRMVAWKGVKKRTEELITPEHIRVCPPKNKDRIDPDCYRSKILGSAKLKIPQVDAQGKPQKDDKGKQIYADETDAQYAARIKLRDELTPLMTALGTSAGAKDLNPYIRNQKNWGEARAGFQSAAIFTDATLRDGLMKIFSDKATHDKIADAWIKKLMKKVAKDHPAIATPTTVAQEKDFAEYVFSKHNGGEAKTTKIADYVAKTTPAWQRIFCTAKTGGGQSESDAYISLTTLKL